MSTWLRVKDLNKEDQVWATVIVMLASARTTYFGHMDMIPWNQHHILHISHHSSVWYPVMQYNSSHITMLLVSFPLIPFHNCHIDLDWQGQYLISAMSVGNSPQMWHPNHGVDLSTFTRWSSYSSIRWLPTLFLDVRLAGSSYRRRCHGIHTGVPTVPWRGCLGGPGCGVWTGTETTWEDRMRERKRKSERVFERRISASLI